MGEPAVFAGTVPVLDACWDVDAVAGMHLDRLLAPFLIVANTSDTNEDLASAFFGMVDMPVVTAAGLEGDVEDADL